MAEILAVVLGISIVLIPVIGLTARFVLKSFLEPLGRILEVRSEGETARVLERRMALLEQQMEALETTVNRLAEVTDFNRELRGSEASRLHKG